MKKSEKLIMSDSMPEEIQRVIQLKEEIRALNDEIFFNGGRLYESFLFQKEKELKEKKRELRALKTKNEEILFTAVNHSQIIADLLDNWSSN